MGIKILILILLAALVTATISGIFGMAGGLIFMGVIASFMGVAQAMVVHGAVQSVSNSYRAYLLRDNIRWDVFGKIALGAVPALALLALASLCAKQRRIVSSPWPFAHIALATKGLDKF